MAEPLQYAKNGNCRFENFPECLNNPNEIAMGDMDRNCMYMKWFMGLEIVPDPEGDRFRAYIRNEFRNENARISFFVLFKFSKFG
ncbi:hypothetical protein L3Y34_009711 [Caenorhabditis briggsae]|uniref:Uncharacterized protein n=1 Tax=Caenorhabditis briggsae TaxID=6238 RepID=A0AAE9D4K1_CAEBR|nr:hypothetical protein L3Y34_009708 [Caenorhabditis briggsae]ULT92162.1 hypothetical protein L3Y34_009711 [Caenorhabditis briggsae]